MPDVREHLQQASHNETFFSQINVDSYSDWAVTVLFYAALHYLDAYLAKQGVFDPGSHDVRDPLIRQFPLTRAVARQYFRLKNFSRSARCYGARFSRSDVTGLQRGEFEAIKTQMMQQLP